MRQLRLHRDGRFEVAVGSSFTLLDQYLRTTMPGGTLTYHFTDWIGVGVFGGYGIQYTTGLTDNIQNSAITAYNCADAALDAAVPAHGGEPDAHGATWRAISSPT